MSRHPPPTSVRLLRGPALMRTMAALLRKTLGYREALESIKAGEPTDASAHAARVLKLHDDAESGAGTSVRRSRD